MITLKNISKKFDHRGIAGIHQLSLHLKKGEVFTLMGPNGSGKSTLLNLISNQLSPDEGAIDIKGKVHIFDVQEKNEDMNVQKFLVSKVKLEMDIEKKIQLSRDLADIFEFTFQLRQNLSQLSQGQKQKVLMAGELINHPEIILLDEPFNHLDPFTRNDILSALFTYITQREITVLWVTHDRNEAFRFATKVGILNFGKLEMLGTPEEVAFNPRNLFVAQFIGHKNFIPVTASSSNTWETPWGPWQKKWHENTSQAIMVIPPGVWEIDEKTGIPMSVLSSYIHELLWEVEVEWEDKRYVLHLPHSFKETLKTSKKLSLSPIFSECFIVPL